MSRTKTQQSFLSFLWTVLLFKPNQGQMVRRITALVLGAIILVGCWIMSKTILMRSSDLVRVGVPCLLGALGLWVIFRLIHYPPFANFLIQVEAEMVKVSWADQAYLVRATSVVIGTMLVLGAFLLVCDAIWVWFFNTIGFLDFEALNPGP